MNAALLANVGHGSTAMWYLTRATGLVSLVLLSATVVLGTVASVGWATDRWPRFLSQAVHRNLSLFCLALIGIHIVTTVADGYVPITYLDAVVPFRSPYRPLYVGFGALAFDMLLAVAITSGLRRRIGPGVWRGVHWLAYACWPVAVVHGLGTGSDSRLPGSLVVFVVCVASVAGAVAWRLLAGRAPSVTWRFGGVLAGALVVSAIGLFTLLGPLRPGWSHRAGTSTSLLAQLSGATSTTAPSSPRSVPAAAPASGASIPVAPFTTTASGTLAQSPVDGSGNTQVTISLALADTSAPLDVTIIGPADGGGVEMHRGLVTFGSLSGEITTLQGTTITAALNTRSGPLGLTIDLRLNQTNNTVTGQVSGALQ